MTRRRGIAVAVIVVGVVLLSGGAAAAHPLGNFTVNRYSGLVISPTSVAVDHVLDLAEIPTAQERPRLDRNRDGNASADELATYAARRCERTATAMRLTSDGRRAPLQVRSSQARLLPGQAGLSTLRLECRLAADLTRLRADTTITFADDPAAEQIGWREVTARGDQSTLVSSDVPAGSISQRLEDYPDDLLSLPVDQSTARLLVRPGGPALTDDASAPGVSRPSGDLGARLGAYLAGHEPSAAVAVLALLAAVVIGAVHAAAPGHGKTLMAFYLSGRGDHAVRAALTVGATVTATHTAGVLLLGLVVATGTTLAPAALYPWFTTASGLIVAAIGLALLRTVWRAQPTSIHVHAHAHPHPDTHQHSHPHTHSANATPTPQPTRAGLVAMGIAGGLLPSPTALVLLVSAAALGRTWLGILLVLAFGVGMALTLALAGLALIRARGHVEQRAARSASTQLSNLVRWLPAGSAAAVVVLGALLLTRGLAGV